MLWLICSLLVGLVAAERFIFVAWRRAVLSPAVMLSASIFVVYVLPLSLRGNYDARSPVKVDRMTQDQVDLVTTAALQVVFWLVVAFVVLSPLLRVFADHAFDVASDDKIVIPRWLVVLNVIVIAFHLAGGVSSIGEFVSRIVRPREFTDARVGFGYLVYVRAAANTVLLALLARWAVNRAASGSRRAIVQYFCAGLALSLGGSKTTILVVPLFLMLAWDRRVMVEARDRNESGRLARRATITFAALMLGLVASFGLLRTSQLDEAGIGVADHITRYFNEAYNSSVVIRDFEGSAEHASSALSGAVKQAFPRALVGEKGPTSFYGLYWKPRYEPNSAAYHVSTYGILAEGHMIGGVPYRALYVVVVLLTYLAIALRVGYSSSPWSWPLYCFTSYWFYFVVRAGTSGPALLYFVIVALGILILSRMLPRVPADRRSKMADRQMVST